MVLRSDEQHVQSNCCLYLHSLRNIHHRIVDTEHWRSVHSNDVDAVQLSRTSIDAIQDYQPTPASTNRKESRGSSDDECNRRYL